MGVFTKLIGVPCLSLILLSCPSATQPAKRDLPVVNIKTERVIAPVFETPEIIEKFIQNTPEYRGSKLLANETIGDPEIRKRFDNFGYAPYLKADLDNDGKDEYAFVLLYKTTPVLVIIKKNLEDEWKEVFSMRLNMFAQIKASDPSVGIFGSPCVIVTSITLKAIHNVCWDGAKYISVDF